MEFLGLGLPELIIIVLILLLLFGAAKLPELGRSIGGFTKEVKKGFEDDKKTTKPESKKEDE
jgi:TatA/E family protein of Tat protein translocase